MLQAPIFLTQATHGRDSLSWVPFRYLFVTKLEEDDEYYTQSFSNMLSMSINCMGDTQPLLYLWILWHKTQLGFWSRRMCKTRSVRVGWSTPSLTCFHHGPPLEILIHIYNILPSKTWRYKSPSLTPKEVAGMTGLRTPMLRSLSTNQTVLCVVILILLWNWIILGSRDFVFSKISGHEGWIPLTVRASLVSSESLATCEEGLAMDEGYIYLSLYILRIWADSEARKH